METYKLIDKLKQMMNQDEQKGKSPADIENIKIQDSIFFQNLNKKILLAFLNFFAEIEMTNYKTIKEIFKLKNTRNIPKPFETTFLRSHLEFYMLNEINEYIYIKTHYSKKILTKFK
jgi:hypothetical protein